MSDPDFPQMDWNASQAEQAEIRAKMRKKLRPIVQEALADLDPADVLPEWSQTVAKKTDDPQPLLQCRDLYRPRTGAQLGILSVVNIDLDDTNSQPTAGGILASGWQVYASRRNLYVSTSNWGWGWNNQASTEIHKFALNPGEGRPEYQASGKVDGWTLNQFSMSEHDGFLRVATTTQETWVPSTGEQLSQAANHVFVMQEDGSRLRTVGSIRDIAPGEQIQSAFFMGDRGYLVTFERIDPLFTIDFSNPRKPKLMGELEVPGFSSYMHPLGEDHILAVGMDGDEMGQVTGMQVSIFDVSDVENPEMEGLRTWISPQPRWGSQPDPPSTSSTPDIPPRGGSERNARRG